MALFKHKGGFNGSIAQAATQGLLFGVQYHVLPEVILVQAEHSPAVVLVVHHIFQLSCGHLPMRPQQLQLLDNLHRDCRAASACSGRTKSASVP